MVVSFLFLLVTVQPLRHKGTKKEYELYYNLSVFVYPVAPEDGTGVTLWLNYYSSFELGCRISPIQQKIIFI